MDVHFACFPDDLDALASKLGTRVPQSVVPLGGSFPGLWTMGLHGDCRRKHQLHIHCADRFVVVGPEPWIGRKRQVVRRTWVTLSTPFSGPRRNAANPTDQTVEGIRVID